MYGLVCELSSQLTDPLVHSSLQIKGYRVCESPVAIYNYSCMILTLYGALNDFYSFSVTFMALAVNVIDRHGPNRMLCE